MAGIASFLRQTSDNAPEKATPEQFAKGYRDCRAWWLQHEPRGAAGIGPWDREWTGRHLASLNGGAIPEAKNLVKIKAKGRLPLRDVALSIRFLEDPVRHPDRIASSRPCSETASRAR